jgi:hypothetical protein
MKGMRVVFLTGRMDEVLSYRRFRTILHLIRSSSRKSIIRHESALSAFLAGSFLAGGTIVRGRSRGEEMGIEELSLFLRLHCVRK